MRGRTKVAILADFPASALKGVVSGRGGGQGCTWLPQLALNFEKRDEFEIHWVTLDRDIEVEEVTRAFNQVFHRVPAVKFSIDLALNYWPARRVLHRAIRAIEPDIVHAWGTERIYPAALKGLKMPSILSMQGVLTELARVGSLVSGWRWRKMVASEPGFIRSATVVTCESQWGIDKVKAVVPEADCRLIEYGVHPSFYKIDWRPNPAQPYLLYIGAVGIGKGFDLLLDALEGMEDRQWACRFVGDARMADEIRERGISGVEVLGLLEWDKLKEQIAGAWAVTLPTRADTSANTVKESRVIGAPVVTSVHGGHMAYMRDGVNGRIVDPLNADNLAAALMDVMSSFERARELGGGRHDEDRDYLRPECTAERFAELYGMLKGQDS
jgi:glycosyltransferase involved in cell wall biosynthesis